MNKITDKIPPVKILAKPWHHLRGLPFADPEHATSGKIDLLIGAHISGRLLLNDSRRDSFDELISQSPSFGWVIMVITAVALSKELHS